MHKYLLFIMALVASSPCFANTVHALLCAETGDPRIAYSVREDHLHMKQVVKLISHDTQKPLQLTELVDRQLTGGAILQWLHNLETSQDDIVIVYYAGHGEREKTNYTPWPYVYLFETKELFPTTTIIEHLANKPHQLFLCAFDCCNSYDKSFPYYKEKQRKAKLTKASSPLQYVHIPTSLFQKKGTVIITASQPMKPAYNGVFTPAFFDIITSHNDLSDWNVAMKQVTTRCEQLSHYNFQRPFYYIDVE